MTAIDGTLDNQYLHFHDNNNSLGGAGDGSVKSGSGGAGSAPGSPAGGEYMEPTPSLRGSGSQHSHHSHGSYPTALAPGRHPQYANHDSGVDVGAFDGGVGDGRAPSGGMIQFAPQGAAPADWNQGEQFGTPHPRHSMRPHEYEELPGLRMARMSQDRETSETSTGSGAPPTGCMGGRSGSHENLCASTSARTSGPSSYRRRHNPLYDSMIRESSEMTSKSSAYSSRGCSRCVCICVSLCLVLATASLAISIVSLLDIKVMEAPQALPSVGGSNLEGNYENLKKQYNDVMTELEAKNSSIETLLMTLESQESQLELLLNHSTHLFDTIRTLEAKVSLLSNSSQQQGSDLINMQVVQSLQATQITAGQLTSDHLNGSLSQLTDTHTSQVRGLEQMVATLTRQLSGVSSNQSVLSVRVDTFSKMPGPQGPAGPAGAGNMSACKHFQSTVQGHSQQVKRTDYFPTRQEAQVSVVTGVTCSSTTSHTKLQLLPASGDDQYRCECSGTLMSGNTVVCTIHYWICPRLS